MPVNIAPGFSVYQLVERVQKISTLLSHRKTMNIISHEIENATLVDDANTRVFSSFQRMSRFLPQVERYRALAQKSQAVYVFGVPDVPVPQIPGIQYIMLEENSQLAKEWFLVSFGEDFASALATEEISNIDDPDQQRQFKGIWTFDKSLVAILEEWLSNVVDAPASLLDEDSLNKTSQKMMTNNILMRLLLIAKGRMASPVIQSELKDIIDGSVRPATAAAS